MEPGIVNCTSPLPSLPSQVPGEPLSTKSKIVATVGDLTQHFAPVNAIKNHLCGFAFYQSDPTRQVELQHYASRLNEDFAQCAVFDSTGKDARLVGVEYVISQKLFDSLSPEEQALWHNHQYDVKSGSFIVPDVPVMMEGNVIKDFINTYGKTWLLWQFDRGDTLPLGLPQLMGVAAKDGDWNPALFENRKKRGLDVEGLLKNRESMEMPPIAPTVDVWRYGKREETQLVDRAASGPQAR